MEILKSSGLSKVDFCFSFLQKSRVNYPGPAQKPCPFYFVYPKCTVSIAMSGCFSFSHCSQQEGSQRENKDSHQGTCASCLLRKCPEISSSISVYITFARIQLQGYAQLQGRLGNPDLVMASDRPKLKQRIYYSERRTDSTEQQFLLLTLLVSACHPLPAAQAEWFGQRTPFVCAFKIFQRGVLTSLGLSIPHHISLNLSFYLKVCANF